MVPWVYAYLRIITANKNHQNWNYCASQSQKHRNFLADYKCLRALYIQHIPNTRQHDQTNSEHQNRGDFSYQSGWSYLPGTTKGLGNSLSIQSRFICARYKCEITFANGYNWKIKNIWRGGGRVYIWSNNNLHGSIISKKQKQTNKNFLFHDFLFAAAPSRWFLKWLRSCCACVIHSSICHHLSHVSWLLSHKIYSRKLNT